MGLRPTRDIGDWNQLTVDQKLDVLRDLLDTFQIQPDGSLHVVKTIAVREDRGADIILRGA
jgi:hypothetical protein